MAEAVESSVSEEKIDVFSTFTKMDWLFVFLLYILLSYGLLEFGMMIYYRGDFDFDFMPLINGTLFIVITWGVARLDRQTKELFRRLDEGAGITFNSPEETAQAEQAVLRLVQRWSRIGALIVSMSVIGGLVSYSGLLTGGHLDWTEGKIVDAEGMTIPFFEFAVLTVVCVPVSALGGQVIGRILANGRFFEVLRELGHDLSGFSSDAGVETVRMVEVIYTYAARCSMALCATLAGWWLAFGFKLSAVSSYESWRWPFAWLWAIAFFTFVFATYRPVMSFRDRVDEIYGGPASQERLAIQLALVRDDIRALQLTLASATTTPERQRIERQLADLELCLSSLKARRFGRGILSPGVLRGVVVANLIALLLPLAFGGLVRA